MINDFTITSIESIQLYDSGMEVIKKNVPDNIKVSAVVIDHNHNDYANITKLLQDEEHINDLMRELDEMQYVTKNMNRKIKKYELGYSNFTFELWMVLHKDEAFASQNHRRDYLNGINKAFNKDYYSLDDFKKEKEFQTILDTLTLNDIIRAIKRAENIEQRNKTNGFKAINHKGYIYYKENPSLSFHEIIKKVLVDTNLLRN